MAGGNIQWFVPPVPTVQSTTTADVNFPNTRLVDYVHPWRAWRSTDLTQQDLVLSLGSPYSNALLNPNFATDLSSWTPVGAVTRQTADLPAGYVATADLNATGGGAVSIQQDYTSGTDLGSKVYKLTAQARLVSGAATATIKVQLQDQTNTILRTDSVTISSASWGLLTVTGTLLAGTFRLRVLTSTNGTDVTDVRVTGFVLRLAVQSVTVLGANFPQVQLASSDDNVAYTNLTGSPFTLTLDKGDNRRKLFSAQQFYAGYLRARIPASYIPDLNVAYYQLGSLIVSDLVTILTSNVQMPFRIVQNRALLQNEVNGRVEKVAMSGFYLTQEWQGLFPTAQLDEWRNLGILGGETILFEYLNLGNAWEIYPMQYDGSMEMSLNDVYYTTNLRMREVV